uniref:DUF6922 domain-containing protein n=1 Tax=candidate division WOR-3 bacterium TaxID=2052148 RepID=A0A7C4X8N8_UNCW3
MKRIPDFLKKYFWEIDSKDLDLQEYRIYVVRRILEYGDVKAVAWLLKNFKKSELKDVLINCRGISRKSANYWAIVLGLPKEKVRCLNRSSLKKQNQIWPY